MTANRSREFREALGAFATGVTIVTTRDAGGEPVGVTASSFNSVSLDPPLVLWSLARSARSSEAFGRSGHFAIHVLAAGQQALSDRFARSGEDKFAGLDWREGALGSPLLEDCAARFECRTLHQYEGGDHVIMVGEVEAFQREEAEPLLFHSGRYTHALPRSGRASAGALECAEMLALAGAEAARLADPEGLAAALGERFTEAQIADATRILHGVVDLAEREG